MLTSVFNLLLIKNGDKIIEKEKKLESPKRKKITSCMNPN